MSSYKGRPETKFSWFIPIDGDGVRAGTKRAERPPTFEYLRQVVETAEDLGFYSLLIPTRFANGLFKKLLYEGVHYFHCINSFWTVAITGAW